VRAGLLVEVDGDGEAAPEGGISDESHWDVEVEGAWMLKLSSCGCRRGRLGMVRGLVWGSRDDESESVRGARNVGFEWTVGLQCDDPRDGMGRN